LILDELDALLRVILAAVVAPRPWTALLRERAAATELIAWSDRALASAGIPPASRARLRAGDVPQSWRAWLEAPGNRLVPLTSSDYPMRLGMLADPPLALWISGQSPALLCAPQLAIVGSRHATRGGMDTAESFARSLSALGLTITSGLAIGIDAAAHRGALRELGGTIAVLGSGIDRIYPHEHTALAAAIETRGLLVSEHPPGSAPRALHFPQRNRIIAALSLGTLVVEAARRSGSLITARLANELGREVFAVPGSIHNPLARGCHALLRDGAKLVEEVADILSELAPVLGLPNPSPRAEHAGAPLEPSGAAQRAVLSQLGFEPRTLTELAEMAGLTAAELSSMLLVLELDGFVEALPGGRYCRRAKRDR